MTGDSENIVLAEVITLWQQNTGCRGCKPLRQRKDCMHRRQPSLQLHKDCMRHRRPSWRPDRGYRMRKQECRRQRATRRQCRRRAPALPEGLTRQKEVWICASSCSFSPLWVLPLRQFTQFVPRATLTANCGECGQTPHMRIQFAVRGM